MPESPNLNLLADRVEELRSGLRGIDPVELARRCAAIYTPVTDDSGELYIKVWGQEVWLSYPECLARDRESGEALPTYLQALLLYYLSTCDGTSPTGHWIAFSELPDGRFYDQAFQGYTGKVLAKTFGDDLLDFSQAAERISGRRVFGLGDAAYAFQALPLVPLLIVYWQGDEDFPANCQVLFDATISLHLPTDACAIIGSNLTRMLIKAKNYANNGDKL